MMSHTYYPSQYSYLVSTSYTLLFTIYNTEKILKVKATTARQKVKSSSHHDVTHVYPKSISLPSIKFITLWFPKYILDKILKFKRIKARSKCCTSKCLDYCPYQTSASYTLWSLIYSPDKILKVGVTTVRPKVISR